MKQHAVILILSLVIVSYVCIHSSRSRKIIDLPPNEIQTSDVEVMPIMISLPRHSERRDHVTKQNIPYELLQDVVDASVLKNPLDNLSCRAFYDFHRRRHDHRTIASLGAIGCYMSHENAWKLVIERDAPQFIIEDDITIVRPDWQELAARWLKRQDKEPWLFFIGHGSIGSKKLTYGTHAYIINPAGAKELLKRSRPMEVQVDMFMRLCFDQFQWNMEFANPTAFKQKYTQSGPFKSTTYEDNLHLGANHYAYK